MHSDKSGYFCHCISISSQIFCISWFLIKLCKFLVRS